MLCCACVCECNCNWSWKSAEKAMPDFTHYTNSFFSVLNFCFGLKLTKWLILCCRRSHYIHTYIYVQKCAHNKYTYMKCWKSYGDCLHTFSNPCHLGWNSSSEINTFTHVVIVGFYFYFNFWFFLFFFCYIFEFTPLFFPAFIYTFIGFVELSHKYRFTFCLIKNYVIITCCAMLL